MKECMTDWISNQAFWAQTCLSFCNTCFFVLCWSWFANVLLRIFASRFSRDIGLRFAFLVMSFSGFNISNAASGQVRKYPFCFYLLKEIVGIGINSFLNVWENPLGLVFLVWKVINYGFNFFNGWRPIHMIYFSLYEPW